MVGKHHFEIENKRIKFVIDIDRKVTVVKGNSGTGKTTLIRMLQGYLAQGNKSGISIKRDTNIPFVVLEAATNWERELAEPESRVIFIDEAVDYIYSKAFQQAFTESNHYVVIISRSGHFNHLPYAIESIYELKTDTNEKIKITKMYRLYNFEEQTLQSEAIITEDSNSGAEMMKAIFDCSVISAGGNGNVANVLAKHINDNKMVVAVVDGAAYGGFVSQTLSIMRLNQRMKLFAPESFEYMLLCTNSFKRKIEEQLESTWKYCDISKYLTWEQYYTEVLQKLCKEEYGFAYSKSKLHKSFVNEETKKQIKEILLCNCVEEIK